MGRKITTNDFIIKANIVHNNTYDYSKFKYVDSKTKSTITCLLHGDFEQRPNDHISGQGCKECSIDKKRNIFSKTKEQFIKEVNAIHHNKYSYSLVKYINIMTSVIIICPTHGEFKQIPNNHLNGNGCKKCGIIKRSKSRKTSLHEFINNSNKLHDYKFDYTKFIYINSHTKGIIICPIHGEFTQRPLNHLNSQYGCEKCGIDNSVIKRLKTKEQFIKDANIIHANKYTYHTFDYNGNRRKSYIKCIKHGYFKQSPHDHIISKNGCPKCNNSKGEIIIEIFLTKNNIKYTPQKKFNDCKYKRELPFDFYLPEYNFCIEYDGEQHYNKSHYFNKDDFNDRVKKDNIKNNYCKVNNIKLIRIRYDENIEDILKKRLIN